MIDLVLEERTNYEIIAVPDLDDGPRWRLMVTDMLGKLDLFVTDNPYVASLLTEDYTIVRPVTLVAIEERTPISGTTVRRLMAQGAGWQELVPETVAHYVEWEGLDERFRHEFGLATLARVPM